MTTNLTPPPPQVRSLFKPPFRTDRAMLAENPSWRAPRQALRLYDADMETVATLDATFRYPVPRGWGRHQYLPDGADRHDTWCAWFKLNIPRDADLDQVANLLNEAWRLDK